MYLRSAVKPIETSGHVAGPGDVDLCVVFDAGLEHPAGRELGHGRRPETTVREPRPNRRRSIPWTLRNISMNIFRILRSLFLCAKPPSERVFGSDIGQQSKIEKIFIDMFLSVPRIDRRRFGPRAPAPSSSGRPLTQFRARRDAQDQR